MENLDYIYIFIIISFVIIILSVFLPFERKVKSWKKLTSREKFVTILFTILFGAAFFVVRFAGEMIEKDKEVLVIIGAIVMAAIAIMTLLGKVTDVKK